MKSKHFIHDPRYSEIRLTNRGKDQLDVLCEDMGGIWAGIRRREELVTQALTALVIYKLGKQYVIQEGKVVIVDEFTGRLMPDRTWREGLHQAVEAKEGVEVTPPKDTLTRISFQRFFRFYKRLAGMTGTAAEATYELFRVYRIPVVRIPTNEPCIRERLRDRIFAREEPKWIAIVEHIQEIHKTGRPILAGTRSVGASERLSEMLTAMGLEHLVLNAIHHEEEAGIVAQAGQAGKITVATNMAGRGTDIKLGRDVAEKGGLHVIATELHESGRIDRQLFGRAGRQGDPGSAIAFASFEDELIQRYASGIARRALQKFGGITSELIGPLPRRMAVNAQARAQNIAARQRTGVLKSDDWFEEFLGFAGSEG